jgi:hypothetical protein
MGLFRKLGSIFSGGGSGEDDGSIHREYVRCSRCGEKLSARVDLRNELTPTYEEGEGAYYARKGLLGSGETRCFQLVEVELYFDAQRNLVSRYVTGGEFITREEFYAEESAKEAD